MALFGPPEAEGHLFKILTFTKHRIVAIKVALA
jgi:hypothetical protein